MSRRLEASSVEALRSLEVPVILVTGNTHCFTRAAAVMLGSQHFVAENGGIISCRDKIEVLADRAPCDQAYELLHEAIGVKKFDSRYRLTDLVLFIGFDVEVASRLLEEQGLPVELVYTGFAVHIKNKGITKGTGLRLLAKRMQLDLDEIAAVGDSKSDLSMFQEAGFSAAVANASAELKDVADYVASQPFGRGFAEAVSYMRNQGMFSSF
jgi:phosphoglycolate phosphatase (TIGR01487 family)